MLFNKDENLLEIAREESRPAVVADGTINIEYIIDSCPTLNNIWEETLRLISVGASARFLTRDVEIGGKILSKGNRIIIGSRAHARHHRERK